MRAAIAITPLGIVELAERVRSSDTENCAGERRWRLPAADGRLALWTKDDGIASRARAWTESTPQLSALRLSIGPGDVIAVRQPPRASTPAYYRICPDIVEIDHDLDRLAAISGENEGLDRSSLLHFVWRGRARPGQTLYAAVRSLGVGEELVCSPGQRPLIRRYWWPLNCDPLPADDEAVLDETLARIDAAVMRDTAGEGIAGSFREAQTGPGLLLSGGVDSSLIAALAQRRGIPLTAFTVGFDEAYGLNELAFARRVARSLRIPHRVVNVGLKDVERLLRRVLASPHPRAAPAAITHAALIEAVEHGGHPRLLSGLGADEGFGGYHKPLQYLAAQTHQMRKRRINLAVLFEISLTRLLRMRETMFLGVAEFFALRELAEMASDREAVQELARVDLDFYRGALAVKPDAHSLELMAAHEYQYRLSELLLPAFGTGEFGTAPSLAYPFLDPDVYLWGSTLDAGRCYWYEGNAWWAKRTLRAAAGRLLPDEIVMRKRQVFLAPIAHWLLAKKLRTTIMEEIADSEFWKLDVLRHELRDRLLTKLRRYRALDSKEAWQEQLWVILALCAWINRHGVSVKLPLRASRDG